VQLWGKLDDSCTIAFTPDGQHLAACFNSGVDTAPNQVFIYSRDGKLKQEWTFPFAPSDLAFTPDGRHLLTANPNGTVYILRLQ